MFDGLAVCDTICMACIWCCLFSKCFPNSISLKEVDSSERCSWKKLSKKGKMSRLIQCCLSSTETLIRHKSCRGNNCFNDVQKNYKYRVSISEDPSEDL